MADEKITAGVSFEGEDNLSDVADRVADNVAKSSNRQEDALEDVEKQADDTGSSMEALAIGVTGVASAMEIATRISEVLKEAILVVTEASLAQRKEGDEGLRTFNALRDTMEDLGALIGDVLIPVANGLFRAFGPILESTQTWLGTNREIMASGIGEFLEGLATFLINGVAVGLKVTIGAWASLRMAVASVTAAISAWVSVTTEGLAAVVGGARAAAEAMGMDGLAGQIAAAEEGLRDFSNASAAISREAVTDVQDIWTGYHDLAETIDGATIPALEAAGRISEEVARQAALEVEKQTAGERRKAEAAEEAAARKAAADAEAAAEAAAALAQEERARSVYYARLARLQAARKADLEEERRLQEEAAREALAQSNAMAAKGAEVGDVFGNMATGLGDATRSAAEVMQEALGNTARLVFDLVRNKVVAYAAEAAAASFAAHSGIPFVGFGIGAAAAGAAFGFVEALLSEIPGFARGGTVPGNGPSADSALIRAMPRERVLSHAEIARTGNLLDRFLSGQIPMPAPVMAAAPSRQIVFQSMFPFATQSEFDAITRRDLNPSLRRVEELD